MQAFFFAHVDIVQHFIGAFQDGQGLHHGGVRCWHGGGGAFKEVPPLVQVAGELGKAFLELGEFYIGEEEVFEVINPGALAACISTMYWSP